MKGTTLIWIKHCQPRFLRARAGPITLVGLFFLSQAWPLSSATSETLPESPEQRRARARWLADLAAGARGPQRLAALFACLSGILLIAQAAAIAWLVQHVLVDHGSVDAAMPVLAGLAAVLVVRALLASGTQGAAGRVADAAKLAMRQRIYRQLHGNGPLWLRGQRGGELGELMLSHTEAVDGYYAGFLPVRTEMVVVPLAIAVAVASVNWVIAVILLFTGPLVPVFMMLVGWGAEAAGRDQLKQMARLGGHFADRLKGLGLLRVYGRGPSELEKVAEAADGVRAGSMRVLRIAFLSSTTLEFFASVSVAMVALYFGLSYLGLMALGPSSPSLGMGVFCLLLAPEFYAPLRKFAAHYHDRANALAAVAEVERLLGGLPAAVDQSPAARQANGMRDDPMAPAGEGTTLLRASHLRLRPLGAPVDAVTDFSMTLQPGERVALIGPSGSGKSTVLEALAGWLPPGSGQLMAAPGLRVVHAGQRPYLFHGSIADNLRLGDPGASTSRLQAVAEAGQVMRFAAQLPDGLDTLVGERGLGLSGGEARRVGLARALLMEADVLLLDEPTAFLDPDTETALLEALSAHARGRSVVVATHSPAVIAWADRVITLPARGEGGNDGFPGEQA